ncbi:hypothetical protein Q31a_31620 [Aureliella helgolandensis]|uniref:Uncharacterized protein n=1 Tax=Aureliella helgolandensis TaxID=2527968 RepID=A0A518G8C6_9BACT|nr:hypothetical protein Q31a_31620 [Aureliella helgolandensis]
MFNFNGLRTSVARLQFEMGHEELVGHAGESDCRGDSERGDSGIALVNAAIAAGGIASVESQELSRIAGSYPLGR